MHKTFPKNNFGHRFFLVEIRWRTNILPLIYNYKATRPIWSPSRNFVFFVKLNQKKSMTKIIFRKSFVHYKIALYMPSMGFIAHELIRVQSIRISLRKSLQSWNLVWSQVMNSIWLSQKLNPSLKVHPVQLLSALQHIFLRSCQIALGMRKMDSP